MVLSSLYVVSFCGTTTNKIIDGYLDTELGIDSIGMGGWEGWSFGVSVFYAGWRGGRRCRDVAMVDKIDATVHVTIKFPSKFGLAQMTYFKLVLSPISLIPVTYSQDATHVISTTPQRRMIIQWLHSILVNVLISLFKYIEA